MTIRLTTHRMLKFSMYCISICSIWAISLQVGHAQGGVSSVTLQNPIGNLTISSLIQKILDTVISIGTPVAVFFIVYSGFLFVMAQGNPAKLENARKSLLWTLIGTAVLLGAWVLAGIIKATIDSLK